MRKSRSMIGAAVMAMMASVLSTDEVESDPHGGRNYNRDQAYTKAERKTIDKRRAANKVARRSRRINRLNTK